MEKAKKILYIAQELEPYVAESDLSTTFRNLIPAVQETGREARTFTPKWGSINERRNMLHEVIRLSGANLIIDGSDHQLIIKVASIPAARMQVYFIDNDDFMRGKLILRDKDGRFYRDNVERSMFFCRGTIETMKKLRWVPEIVHCTGWMGALAPYLLKMAYYDEPCFRESCIIFTPSISENLDQPMPRNLKGIIAYREACLEALAPLGRLETLDDLNRIGMFMADGVVLTAENEHFQRMAKEMAKPVVIIDKENLAQNTVDLYDRLWDEAVQKRPKKEDEDDGFLF
ncbi:MAG: glycogen/starch synthase [Bacteroidaceae bacterium]|nr:glycogen/starch synthase [Bacteroidaceae bacterium]